MKIVKYILNTYNGQSRDKREVELMLSLGFDVELCTFEEDNSIIVENNLTWFKRKRPKFNKIKFIRYLQIIYNLLIIEPRFLFKKKAYAISCHDLTALSIAFLSNAFRFKNKSKLIYDSHEFELGRNLKKKRGQFRFYMVKLIEKFLIKKTIFTIVVNQSISKELIKVYKLKTKPVVVRNIPNYYYIDSNVCSQQKVLLLHSFENKSVKKIIMYHGVITINRGIENTIKAISRIPTIGYAILGYFDNENYKSALSELISLYDVKDRVIFIGAIDNDQLWKYVGAADIGMILHRGLSKSYYFGLPNKLFENIQSLTPVLISDFPEPRKIVQSYSIGELANPESVDDIVEKLLLMFNKIDSKEYCQGLNLAKKELHWDNEKRKLFDEYCKIMRQ